MFLIVLFLDEIVLKFGKIKENEFFLEVRHPLSIF